MAFGLGKLADPLHEGERFPEIAESKRALDAVGFIAQLPIQSLALEAARVAVTTSYGSRRSSDPRAA
jgi:hypothetical protein